MQRTATPVKDTAPSRAPAEGSRRSRLTQRGVAAALRVIQLGPAVVLAALWVAMALLSPYFFTSLNLFNLLQASAIVAVLAVGQLVVVLTGAIDLSAGAVVALAAVVGAKLTHAWTDAGPLIAAAMLATGALVGVVNGLIIERARLGNSFVVTLGTMSAALGASYVVSKGATITGLPRLLTDLGGGKALGIPAAALVVVGLGLAAGAVMAALRWGRWIYAVGGNREAASRVGIPVRAVSSSVFVFSGLAAGLAGILSAGLTDSGAPTGSFNTELDAISAVVIGGAALTGGRGTVIGALVGSLILGTVHNGLNLLNVDTNWEPIVLGAVLVLAVAMDLARSNLETRLRLLDARQQGDVPEPA